MVEDPGDPGAETGSPSHVAVVRAGDTGPASGTAVVSELAGGTTSPDVPSAPPPPTR